MTGPTGAAAPTGAATGATGAGPTGATGATGSQDPRLKAFKAPEKFASEPWAKEVKDVDDLWAKMAGAQKLIGKNKIAVPGEGAPKEEVEAYHKALGRPDNPEGYEFKNIEDLKEVKRNTDLDHGMKKIFHEEGIPKAVGERIIAKSEALLYGMQKPAIEAAAKREVEFQKLASDVLGEDRVSSMEAFKTVMKDSLGDKAHLVAKIENMSNEELLPLIVLGKNIHDRYAGESTIVSRPGGLTGLSGDLKADFQALSSQKIAIKTDKNMAQHIKQMKLANINAAMTKIGQQAADKGIDLFKR